MITALGWTRQTAEYTFVFVFHEKVLGLCSTLRVEMNGLRHDEVNINRIMKQSLQFVEMIEIRGVIWGRRGGSERWIHTGDQGEEMDAV